MPESWNDEELKAAVSAYVDMHRKESAGKSFVKKHYYDELSEQFSRTAKSYEYRMQNISYAYSLQGRQWVWSQAGEQCWGECHPAPGRTAVTDAYQRRCAMTGENTLVTLEAAHIKPFAQENKHDVRNGLLLRADFHRLFDTGLVGIDPDYRIRISPKIHELYFNGKAYYRLDGKALTVLPSDAELKPDREKLDWHMQNCFQAS